MSSGTDAPPQEAGAAAGVVGSWRPMSFSAELDVAGRLALVCGADPAALPVISDLIRARASVRVVARSVPTTIRDLAARRVLTWQDRAVREADFDEAAVVIAASGQDTADDAVCAAAAAHHRVAIRAAAGAAVTGHAVANRPAEVPDVETSLSAPTSAGRVILVGAGPGDPGLLTLAGQRAVRMADVIVSDRLAPLDALRETKPGARIIDVGKIPRGEFTPQEQINRTLIDHAQRGSVVVRFKGGDSFVFGRGGEEWQACAEAGIPVEVIPGVTSAVAGPAVAGIPLTHRSLTQGFTVVSGHLPPGAAGSTLGWAALAQTNTTLVILMGVSTLPAITDSLMSHGLPGATPAVTVADAGLSSQRVVRGRLDGIADLNIAAGISAPAITVVGAVAGFAPET